jgi:teneurin
MLQWPTALAINPLDDTLHVLDGSMVLKLTRYGHVFPVAGRAHHCPPSNHNLQSQLLLDRESTSIRLATDLPLVRPQHIAFNPAGDMYIVEEGNGGEPAGTKSVNRVRVVGTSGVMSDYVGGGGAQSCDCRQPDMGSDCLCLSGRDETPASESKLGAPAAVTVTPDGVVHVADMGNLRVHSIVVALPTADRVTGHYDVIDDTSQELYTFNR